MSSSCGEDKILLNLETKVSNQIVNFSYRCARNKYVGRYEATRGKFGAKLGFDLLKKMYKRITFSDQHVLDKNWLLPLKNQPDKMIYNLTKASTVRSSSCSGGVKAQEINYCQI